MPSELFPLLEPPRGGLARLRARMARDARRRARARRLTLASATLGVLVVAATALLRFGGEPEPLDTPFRLARIRHGLEPVPGEILSIAPEERGRVAVLRVPLDTDRVVLYRVGFARPEPAPARFEPQALESPENSGS